MVKLGQTVKRTRFVQHAARHGLDELGRETGAFRILKAGFGARFPRRTGQEWDLVLHLQPSLRAPIVQQPANSRADCADTNPKRKRGRSVATPRSRFGFARAAEQSGRDEPLTLLVECREHLSPKTALELLDASRPPSAATLLLFSPAISPRVAEICRQRQVGYLDAAGNCLLRAEGLYIERRGRGNVRPDTRPIRRLFSPKASRVTRALLTEPARRWQVQALAAAARVSLGLVSKVKQTLLSEGYAVERDRLLSLCGPRALLDAWARAYAPRVEPVRLRVPGDTMGVAVARWLESNSVPYALTQLAGAGRTTGAVEFEDLVFWVAPLPPSAWTDFQRLTGGERVESGENVVLWQTGDASVFDGARPLGSPPLATVSPLQLYLDLQLLDGGGQPAEAVYEQQLTGRFRQMTAPDATSARDDV